jgi:hypothetical protein
MESLDWIIQILHSQSREEVLWLVKLLGADLMPEVLEAILSQYKDDVDIVSAHWDTIVFNSEAQLAAVSLMIALKGVDHQPKIYALLKDLNVECYLSKFGGESGTFPKILESLLLLAPHRSDPRFWRILASLVLSANFTNRPSLLARLLKQPKERFTLFHIRRIISKLDGAELLKLSPSLFEYLPPKMRPLQERLLEYQRSNLILAERVETVTIHYARNYLIIIHFERSLYLNIRVTGLPGQLTSNIGGAAVFIAARELESKTGQTSVLSSGKLAVLIGAWPYLIAERAKLDYSILFGDSAKNENWSTFQSRLRGMNSDFGGILESSKVFSEITRYFSLQEFQSLVNSSYNTLSCLIT